MNYCLFSFCALRLPNVYISFSGHLRLGTVRNLSNLKPSIGVLFQLPDFRNETAHLSLSRFSQFNHWNHYDDNMI